MPRVKTSRTAITPNITKAREDAEATSIDKSKSLDPNLTTTITPRRSPRKHGSSRHRGSSETATEELSLSEAYEQSTIGTHTTIKKDSNVRNTTALRATTEATITSNVTAKSSQEWKDKAEAVVQSNRQISGSPKGADPVPLSRFTRQLRSVRGSKFSTKSEQGAGRDSEPSASRHRTKRHSGKTDDPRKASAIERDPQNNTFSTCVTEPISAPIDDAETRHATEPQVGPSQEEHRALGSRQLLTGEALEELARGLESIDPTNRNLNSAAKKIAVGHSGEESEDGSSQRSAINSQERAYHKNPASAETMIGIGSEKPEFLSGLRLRNVLSDPSTYLDPREEDVRSLSLDGYLQETQEQEIFHEELWKSDKAKCTPDSSEALYQRTLMISLIARHMLIYQVDGSKEHIFDFSVEEPWGCLPMPSRLVWSNGNNPKPEAKFLTQPKPDLAVCFRREAVMSDSMWQTLPEPTKGLACFENSSSSASRVFHFLAVEAKKAMLDVDSPQALHQCLNNASQALHNMHEFFRDAGPEHEQVFYDKVRFFSVVAKRSGIIVRIHRAIKKPDDASKWELVMPDRPDYRLQLEFREFQRISDADGFYRKKVLEVFKKILKYATDDLLKVINAAASKLVQNLREDLELYHARCEVDFYSYGQPNPKTSQSSRRTSGVLSTNDDGVQRQFQSANLGPNYSPSESSMASRQMTSKQPYQPIISSRLAPTVKKRRADEIDSNELEDMRAPDPPARKCRKPS